MATPSMSREEKFGWRFTLLLMFSGLALFIWGSSQVDFYSAELFGGWTALGLVLMMMSLFSMFGTLIGKAAVQKGRSFWAFFILSLLIGPLVMGIVVAIVSPTPGSPRAQVSTTTTSSTTPDLETTLGELKNLHDKGLITDEEYDRAKRKSLGIED